MLNLSLTGPSILVRFSPRTPYTLVIPSKHFCTLNHFQLSTLLNWDFQISCFAWLLASSCTGTALLQCRPRALVLPIYSLVATFALSIRTLTKFVMSNGRVNGIDKGTCPSGGTTIEWCRTSMYRNWFRSPHSKLCSSTTLSRWHFMWAVRSAICDCQWNCCPGIASRNH